MRILSYLHLTYLDHVPSLSHLTVDCLCCQVSAPLFPLLQRSSLRHLGVDLSVRSIIQYSSTYLSVLYEVETCLVQAEILPAVEFSPCASSWRGILGTRAVLPSVLSPRHSSSSATLLVSACSWSLPGAGGLLPPVSESVSEPLQNQGLCVCSRSLRVSLYFSSSS